MLCERVEYADESLAKHDIDMPALQALQLAQLRQRVLLVGRPLPKSLHQEFAGLCGANAAAQALDQGDAEILLEQRDLPADHRRIDVEPFSRGADRAEPHGLVQVAQAVMIEQSGHVTPNR